MDAAATRQVVARKGVHRDTPPGSSGRRGQLYLEATRVDGQVNGKAIDRYDYVYPLVRRLRSSRRWVGGARYVVNFIPTGPRERR